MNNNKMTQGERVKAIRKASGLTLDKFGEKLGVTKQTISRIENGVNNLTNQMALAICREYNVNMSYLSDGIGEMFAEVDDDIADIVSHLLEESNPFYDLVLDIMKTFDQLDDKGKAVFCDFVDKFSENVAKRKKEDD